ncbi:hypothetical protein OG321_42305 [Streptomyces sp. NBC_00424]|uniref:DUF6573 family protein n=1 Tax=Streptomyces sp. NBC_00424 TaxID=2903648 RepID=UPI00224EFD2A|nr:DUF6573 family protein [Streptomyces sp. NBC_00424]MCX5079031.1 hypothetical protein [Streptomyces sp. NBC_00424]
MRDPNPSEAASSEPFGPVIGTYSRADAIADGVLVTVPENLAKEAGFRFPVALTSAAWVDCVKWTDADSEAQDTPQDETGRLWDVLCRTVQAIKRAPGAPREVEVLLYRVPRDGTTPHAKPARLKSVCGPGDDRSPVITIMRPDES